MRRFFVTHIRLGQSILTLEPEQSHHIAKVLRLRPGTAILLFDGQGNEFQATIKTVKKKVVTVQITADHFIAPLPPTIHLHLGLLKGKKMDFLIQKMTEMGIDYLHPFTSDYSVATIPTPKRLQRWRKIMLEACKQCGRARLMTIAEPTTFNDGIKKQQSTNTMVFWEDEPQQDITSISNMPKLKSLHFFIGPEGGFSPPEIATIKQAKIPTLSLGRLTLRAETAVICAATLLLFQSGRLSPAPSPEGEN